MKKLTQAQANELIERLREISFEACKKITAEGDIYDNPKYWTVQLSYYIRDMRIPELDFYISVFMHKCPYFGAIHFPTKESADSAVKEIGEELLIEAMKKQLSLSPYFPTESRKTKE